MIISISLQNTTFIILMIVVISTIVVILTILMLIITKKEHKRFLNISFDFDFQISKDLIIFINHTSRRNKFKDLNYSFSSFFIN